MFVLTAYVLQKERKEKDVHITVKLPLCCFGWGADRLKRRKKEYVLYVLWLLNLI